MRNAPGLATYLALSPHLVGLAERTLERRLQAGKEDPVRIAERRGQSSVPRPKGPLVWFHAASVGESLSILELITRLIDERPEISVLITTGTRSSADLMEKRMPDQTIHQFAPMDTVPFVRAFLDHWKPDMAVWTESELWPAMIAMTRELEIPMVLMNARMSEKSHAAWRWLPGTAKSILRKFDQIMVQDKRTAYFLRRLGAEASRLQVNGSLKQTTGALPHRETDRARFAKIFDNRPVWLAASTHDPEELVAAEAHRTARKSSPRLLLIIAPRHPERGTQICEDLRKAGWRVAQRSVGEEPESNIDIYVADTLGEMGLWFRLAPVCFLGGSIAEIGGHNPFEPAALGSAILHGPHVANAAETYAAFDKAGAAHIVRNSDELAAEVAGLQEPQKAAEMAHIAWEVSSSGAEASDRALSLLLDLLDKTGKI